MFFQFSLNFEASAKNYKPAFSQQSSIDFSCDLRDQNHSLMLNIAITMNRPIESAILIESQIQIHFVMFIRGHPGTPIDIAPVLLSGKPCSTSQDCALVALRDIKSRIPGIVGERQPGTIQEFVGKGLPRDSFS